MTQESKLLLFGSNGMFGQRVAYLAQHQGCYDVVCSSIEEENFNENCEYIRGDITDKDFVKNIIKNTKPDLIINAAAYTNVDKAEDEKMLCWKINTNAVEYMVKYCKVYENIHFIHISTDYVFDGKNGPYKEEDRVNPLGYYAKSKLAAENAIVISNIKYTILRTNVLYGPAKKGRPDFVKWVIEQLGNGKTINIVDDQINNPTYLDDLALAALNAFKLGKTGIYHIGGEEFMNRYEFTLRIADYYKLDKALVHPIKTEELKQKAPRPLKSGLIIDKARRELGYNPTPIDMTFDIMKKELKI